VNNLYLYTYMHIYLFTQFCLIHLIKLRC